jgi:hypothetical protein
VSRAGWTSALLALLLVASLTGKFVVGYERGANDDQGLTDEVERRLTVAGFTTSIEHRPSGLVVHGVRGRCRLIARDGDTWPMMSVIFQQRARPYGPLHYVYRGNASVKPPRIRPTIDRAIRHLLRAIGTEVGRPALLAVAAAPSCGAIERLFDGVLVARAPLTAGATKPDS